MKGMKWIGIVVLAVFLTATAALAAETTQDEYSLGEIVVQGDRVAESDLASSLSEVTAEEIKASNARTLNEAISLLPGVYIRTGGDGTPRIDIRGMRTRNVLILLDGVPLNSSYDYQFDPTLIPVENIARIKVYRGGASVLFGANGNAGVINIITKKGKPGVHGFANAEASQENAWLYRAGLNGGNENIQAFVGGSWFKTDGFVMSDSFDETDLENGEVRENSQRSLKHIYANLAVTPTEDTTLGLSLRAFEADHGVPYMTEDNKAWGKLRYEDVDDNSGFSFQVSGSHDFGDLFSLRGWAFYNTESEDSTRYDDADMDSLDKKGSYEQSFDVSVWGAALQPRLDFDALGSLTANLSYMRQEWEGTQDKVEKNGDPLVRQYDQDRELDIYTAGLEYEVKPSEFYGLTAGVAWHQQGKDEEGSESEYSYFLGATVTPFEGTIVHLNHARKIRFPSLKELYDGDSANPDLEAEKTMHYELGIEQRLPFLSMNVGLTGFIIDADDFIEKVDDVSQNNDKYRMKGVEAFMELSPVEALRLAASYTYTEAFNRGDDRLYDRLQNRPRHMASLEARYNFSFGLMAYLSWSYIADQVDYSADEKNPGLLHVDDASVVDFKLSQSFELDGAIEGDELELYLGAHNIFDAEFNQSIGLPAPGRSFYAGMEYRF